MNNVGKLVAAGAAAAALLVGEQFWHFHRQRRDELLDTQPLLHGRSVRHLLLLFRVAAERPRPGTPLLAAHEAAVVDVLRALKGAVAQGGALLVYAGMARFPGSGQSRQLGPVGWDAGVLVQCPSASAAAQLRASPAWEAVITRCDDTHHVEFQRSREMSFMWPLMMLYERLRLTLSGTRILPFQDATDAQRAAGVGASVDGRDGKARGIPKSEGPPGSPLDPARDAEPTVVINLDRSAPTKRDRDANASCEPRASCLVPAPHPPQPAPRPAPRAAGCTVTAGWCHCSRWACASLSDRRVMCVCVCMYVYVRVLWQVRPKHAVYLCSAALRSSARGARRRQRRPRCR